jgi:hypothetical protein
MTRVLVACLLLYSFFFFFLVRFFLHFFCHSFTITIIVTVFFRFPLSIHHTFVRFLSSRYFNSLTHPSFIRSFLVVIFGVIFFPPFFFSFNIRRPACCVVPFAHRLSFYEIDYVHSCSSFHLIHSIVWFVFIISFDSFDWFAFSFNSFAHSTHPFSLSLSLSLVGVMILVMI